jgi:predicted dehydrogenase
MASGASKESFRTETTQQFTGKKLRVAIVGCGGISNVHLKSYKRFADVEVVAGVDIKPDRLEWIQREHGVPEVFESWKEMLKKVEPDAVDVCTPNAVHAPAVIDALNAGCHAMTEKPMAMTPRECQQMIAAARKNRKKLAVGFQSRFNPQTTFLVNARNEGTFGDIMFVKCQALRRRGIPNWGVFGQKELQGGGPMIDIGVHLIEVAHYMIGSPKPVAATGNTWTYHGNKPSTVASQWPGWDYKTYTVEDLAIGHIRFDNGAIMQIEASFVAHIQEDMWNVTFMGQKGGASWDPAMIFTDRYNFMTNTSPTYVGKTDFDSMHEAKLRNWVDGCLYNKPLLAPGEAGLDVQKIIDGVYRSAEAGKEVKID